MRKAISLLLVLCMVFALCGCGSGGSTGSADTVKEENATVSSGETEKDLISIEEFSIDNDRGYRNVKFRNLSGDTIPGFLCDYILMDNSGDIIDTTGHICENSLIVDDGQAFTVKDSHVMAGGDYSKIAMVKFTGYTIREVLNGNILWAKEYRFIDPPKFIRNSDGTFSKYSGTDGVALSDAPSAVESSDEDITDATVYALNDTVETDTVKLTVSEFFYADQLVGNLVLAPLGKLNPSDGEIWACIGLTLENIGKSTFQPYDVLNVTIDYNDGYEYSTEESTAAIISYPDLDAYYYKAGGAGMSLSPLTSGLYSLAISCSPKLREDTESTINVIFELPCENGTKTFVYKVQ